MVACRQGRYLSIVLLLLLSLLSSCYTSTELATAEPIAIAVGGSTEMRPLLEILTFEFSRQHPHVLFTLWGGGSALAESWVRSGELDLAATSVAPADGGDEELVYIPIALDGLAVVVHATNPVETLTAGEVQNLFSGHILNWSELGGDDREILLVSREDGSGSRRLFEERIMGEERVALTAVVMPTSEHLLDYIADRPAAVGYISWGFLAREPGQTGGSDAAGTEGDSSGQVKAIALGGSPLNRQTVQSQSYMLSRALYLVRRRDETGWIQAFIDYVLSPAGQVVVDRYHVRIR